MIKTKPCPFLEMSSNEDCDISEDVCLVVSEFMGY